MKKAIILSAFLAVAGAAGAQTRSSFLGVDVISDIAVQVSNGGLTYNVQVGNAPTFTYNNTVYHITDVIGFYTLSDDDDLTAVNQNVGVWQTNNSNAGTGGIAGWKTNPNTGLTPGQSFTFNFDSLNVASVERLGYHVRIDGTFPGTQGNTGNITTVPEPASLLVIGSALASLAARRRMRK
ncbi:MAG: PEP-CTERM sorting domain-containing protein [Armatimonadetes bacterium]|nr:PEP-CTERM sorting domain-containing protein [Armatimonadota bacterium]